MHEFSIASQIWGSVARAARERGGKRVLSVKLEVGVLNLLEQEQLSFWIKTLAERDGSPEVGVEIVALPGRIKCNDCDAEEEAAVSANEWDHFVPLALSCKACGSRNVTVLGGREIRVVSAEIETEGGDGSNW